MSHISRSALAAPVRDIVDDWQDGHPGDLLTVGHITNLASESKLQIFNPQQRAALEDLGIYEIARGVVRETQKLINETEQQVVLPGIVIPRRFYVVDKDFNRRAALHMVWAERLKQRELRVANLDRGRRTKQ